LVESLLQVPGLIHPGKLFDSQGLVAHNLPLGDLKGEQKLFYEKSDGGKTFLGISKGEGLLYQHLSPASIFHIN
tara:strand:+ start:623 stop:844 length:222 start_codon:yes stop_codon:yes gene_type:complete